MVDPATAATPFIATEFKLVFEDFRTRITAVYTFLVPSAATTVTATGLFPVRSPVPPAMATSAPES